MPFMPRKEYKLELRCSKESALNVLKLNTGNGGYYFTRSKYHKKMFWGKFNEENFHLHYTTQYGKPITIVTGVINDSNKKCILDLKIKAEINGKIVMFGGIVISAIILFSFLRNIIVSGEFNWEILIPFGFGLFWYFALKLAYKQMVDYTVKRIERLFEHRII